jgi:hypothetical protein
LAINRDHQPDTLKWYHACELGMEGQGWDLTIGRYDRLPARARAIVPEDVWERSRCPAGLCTHFKSDTTELHFKWTLENDPVVVPQMLTPRASGIDLYATDAQAHWRWVGCFPPQAQTSTASIDGLLPGLRTYRVYLPLFNPVSELQIAVPDGAVLHPVVPRTVKPIVYYGTSIVHGAAASRPGMCHASLLGRRLNRPMVNLGFAGRGRMELPLAELLAELDPCVYLLDCLPNMTADLVNQRAYPFIQALRSVRPKTPIMLIEDRTYTNAWIVPGNRSENDARRSALRTVYRQLLDEGVTGLTYVEGEQLLGQDSEATVDASHPNDIGFWRLADALEPLIRPLINT